MKKIVLFAISLGLTVSATGTTAGAADRYLVNGKDLSRSAPETITRQQAVEDTQFFVEIMRGGYVALAVMREKDTAADSILSGLVEKAGALPEQVGVKTLLEMLAAPLGAFRDTHLTLLYRRADGSYTGRSPTVHQKAYMLTLPGPKEEILVCGGMTSAQLMFPFLQKTAEGVAVSSAPVYFSTKPVTEIQCTVRRGGKSVEVTAELRRNKLSSDAAGPDFSMQEEDIQVLRLKSLDISGTKDIDGFVRSAVKLRSSPSFVLDVRGNHGGSDLSVDAWLETLSGEDGLNRDKKGASRFLLGPVTIQGLLNSLAGLGDSPQVQKLSAHVREKQNGISASQSPVFVGGDEFWGNVSGKIYIPADKASVAYRGGVVILSDSVCASSCENLVAKLRSRLKAPVILVGQNTSGAGDYGELGTYMLPNSRIKIMMGTTQYMNGPYFLEGRGYLPDFWIAEEDPLPAAKAAALCLRDKNCAVKLTGNSGSNGDSGR